MISIIILTYNSEKYIKELVESIYKFNENEDFEVLVIDNKSQDGTIMKLRESRFANRSNLKIIETGENLGFSKGINFGAKKATGEYLLFVNPDSSWKEGSIYNFLTVFEHFSEAGIVGGNMEYHGVVEKSAGKFLKFWAGFATAFGFDNTFGIRFAPLETSAVDFVSGGFMMVKADLFEKLSGFDTHYFMYVEDMDLCFRAKRISKLTYSTPHAVLSHAGQGSSDKSFAFKHIAHGLLYFNKKYSNAASYAILKVLFTLKSLILVMMGKMRNN